MSLHLNLYMSLHLKSIFELKFKPTFEFISEEEYHRFILDSKIGEVPIFLKKDWLAFLSDNSADLAKTEAFLDRRLADVAKLPKMARPAKALADMAMRFAGPIMRGRRAR